MLMQWVASRRFEGAFLQGTNLWEWDAHVFDAFAVFAREYASLESARMEADSQKVVY